MKLLLFVKPFDRAGVRALDAMGIDLFIILLSLRMTIRATIQEDP